MYYRRLLLLSIYIKTSTHMHAYVHTCISKYTLTHIHTRTYIYLYTSVYTLLTHTDCILHIYTYMYAQTMHHACRIMRPPYLSHSLDPLFVSPPFLCYPLSPLFLSLTPLTCLIYIYSAAQHMEISYRRNFYQSQSLAHSIFILVSCLYIAALHLYLAVSSGET